MAEPEIDAILTERDALREVVAKMWEEYNRDQFCDYHKINGLIEEAAQICANACGGYPAFYRMVAIMKKLWPESDQ